MLTPWSWSLSPACLRRRLDSYRAGFGSGSDPGLPNDRSREAGGLYASNLDALICRNFSRNPSPLTGTYRARSDVDSPSDHLQHAHSYQLRAPDAYLS